MFLSFGKLHSKHDPFWIIYMNQIKKYKMYNIKFYNNYQELKNSDKKMDLKLEYLKQNLKEQFEKGLITEFEYKRKLKKITY